MGRRNYNLDYLHEICGVFMTICPYIATGLLFFCFFFVNCAHSDYGELRQENSWTNATAYNNDSANLRVRLTGQYKYEFGHSGLITAKNFSNYYYLYISTLTEFAQLSITYMKISGVGKGLTTAKTSYERWNSRDCHLTVRHIRISVDLPKM